MKNKSNKAFSIIEILIWIFIFSLWLISVYAIIVTTIRINDYNSNYIVATNLAKEQIELIKNIRDSNYKVLKPFDLKNPNWDNFTDISERFLAWRYYKIENIFWSNFPVKVDEIIWFNEWKDELNWDMLNYRLCIDTDINSNTYNMYTYDCNLDDKETEYYRFIYIDELYNDEDDSYNGNAYKIKSKVIWNKRWYHEFEINTVLADWKRL